MASIAYITDAKMLEQHRLNRCQTINFWRLSSVNNFREFAEGDLLFFLSKDKKHQRKGEKGIIGYGRAEGFHSSSMETMWKNYGPANGYSTKEDFKNALLKVSKSKTCPKKMSGIELRDVVFFQAPIYLSECGMNVPKTIESFIYLDEEIPAKILSFAEESPDIWTLESATIERIQKEELRYTLERAVSHLEPLHKQASVQKKAGKELLKYGIRLFSSDKSQGYILKGTQKAEIYYPFNKKDDIRLYIGQSVLLKKEVASLSPCIELSFYLINEEGKTLLQ